MIDHHVVEIFGLVCIVADPCKVKVMRNRLVMHQ